MSLVETLKVMGATLGAWFRSLFRNSGIPEKNKPVEKPDVDDDPLVYEGSGFVFGKRSSENLMDVDPALRSVASQALHISTRDFTVIEGLRTLAEQKKLLAVGATQTLNSKHLSGRAIDVAALDEFGAITWEAEAYFEIATAFAYAAKDLGVSVRWGGAWHLQNIAVCAEKPTPGETMVELYKHLRKSQGRGIFLDLGHFELT